MLDFPGLKSLVDELTYSPLFVTVSGAHYYGFPSPDSDIDLRGVHLLPLEKIVRLDPPVETLEKERELQGIEVELVSHDIAKYLRMLVKNNGYVLEQIFSPHVVCGLEFLEKLRPLARRCITKYHYYHYRGFLGAERRLLDKPEQRTIKRLLYAYRVALTGIYLLRTGEVEAHLPTLAAQFALAFVPGLIEMKTREKLLAPDLDWHFHFAKLAELEQELQFAYESSLLPEIRDRDSISQFLVNLRLGRDAAVD